MDRRDENTDQGVQGGELGLIARIRARLSASAPHVVLGPGDDAALISAPPGELLVVTTDTINEDVHFRLSWMSPKTVGRKTVVQGVSDIAAMGAKPLGTVVGLSIAASSVTSFFDGFLDGLIQGCADHSCPLVGGNLARTAGGISVTATMFGSVAPGQALLRSACRPGDGLWVTGFPGSAAAGFEALERGLTASGLEPAVARFLYPVPRVSEAGFLRKHAGVRCAIDLSDGARKCAFLVAEESRVRIELDSALFPVCASVEKAAALCGRPARSFALDGGEDFELMFAGEDCAIGAVKDRFLSEFGVPLTRIGSASAGSGLCVLRDPGGGEFEHFANRPH